jgi:hypothetical protein
METSWTRKREGWVRAGWVVREGSESTPEEPCWELCKRGADGNLRALNHGPTARGMMDFADIRDGV